MPHHSLGLTWEDVAVLPPFLNKGVITIGRARRYRLAARIVIAGDRGVGIAFAQQAKDRPVMTVKVRSDLQMASVVNERSLVGQMDGDRRGQIDGPLAFTVHLTDTLGAVAFARLRD